ncbi:MAG TPA: hypothetical protein VNE67_14950 [Acetobacteraceae bacterium]|nr:hypothetical protein [Acetobacteraceae bacterium]
MTPEICDVIAAEPATEGSVVRQGTSARLRDHQLALVPADVAVWREIQPLEAGGLPPPTIQEADHTETCRRDRTRCPQGGGVPGPRGTPGAGGADL